MTGLKCNSCDDGVQTGTGFLRTACNVCEGQGVIRLSRAEMIKLAIGEKQFSNDSNRGDK